MMFVSAELAEAPPMSPDDIVRATVRGLSALRRVRLDDLATGAGIPRSTFHRKLRGVGPRQPFTAGEVATLARYFDVEVGVLFSGLGYLKVPPARFERARTVYSVGTLRHRHLSLVPPCGGPQHDTPTADETLPAPMRLVPRAA